jgi:hypothetical protein
MSSCRDSKEKSAEGKEPKEKKDKGSRIGKSQHVH